MRGIIEKYYRHIRAKEEISRLNVEIRRLRTWMRDDEAVMKRTLDTLTTARSPLAYEMAKRLRSKQFTNTKLAKRLDKVESLQGFSGQQGCGVGEYTMPTPITPTPLVSSSLAPTAAEEDEEDDDQDDDDEVVHMEMDLMNSTSKRMARMS